MVPGGSCSVVLSTGRRTMLGCPGLREVTMPMSYLQPLQEFTAAVVSEEVQAGGLGFCAGLSQGGPAQRVCA